ncbi:MAG: DUF5686 and carboxypeptidase regulatory-like domain-containing protein, partial [Bacteroidota bacterium]
GKVLDQDGNPLAFVNIVLQGTSRGTTSNTEGDYELSLPAGDYTLVFQYIGYQKKTQLVELGNDDFRLDIFLQESTLEMPSITVTGKQEDPAYAIIRQAQEKRKFYLEKEYESYQCQVYTKIFEEAEDAGGTVNLFGTRREVEKGIFYLSETQSQLNFQQKNRRKEFIKASKAGHDTSNYSYNRAVYLNFYENYSLSLNSRRIISPIGEQALKHYKYELEGIKKEDGQDIYKIKLLPRYKKAPVFTGYIYIIDKSWRLHSIDVHVAPDVVPAFDSTSIRQIYVPIAQEQVWLPFSLTFYFQVYQGRVKGFYHSVSSDYKLNPPFPDDFFDNQILLYEAEATLKTEDFWAQNRPIPLTDAEKKKYGLAVEDEMDEFDFEDELVAEEEVLPPAFPEDAGPNFNLLNFVFGGAAIRSGQKGRLYFKPLLELVNFNTVEGLVLDYWLRYEKKLPKARKLTIAPHIRYGFANEEFQSQLKVDYSWRIKPGKLSLSGGRYVEQLARFPQIEPLYNTLYSLLREENFLKLYQKSYIQASFSQEWVNGFSTVVGLEYARRQALVNNSNYTWRDVGERDYTPNNPFNVEQPLSIFPDHDALLLQLGLRFAIRQEFLQRPEGKEITATRGPIFELYYRGGFADLNYSLLQGRIRDRFSLGVVGRSELLLEGGIFLNNDFLAFPDFHHFAGNRTFILQRERPGNFQLLDYYTYSTQDQYIQGHFMHHFDGLLLGLIPGVRNLNWNLLFAANYLSTPSLQNYVELGLGIEKIFNLIRIDWYHSLNREENSIHGFRLRIGR